jgi:hypothetical protein
MDLHYSLKTVKTEGKIANNHPNGTDSNRFLSDAKIVQNS